MLRQLRHGYKITIDQYIQIIYDYCMSSKTINISLPAELVEAIDREAKEQFANRSDFIRQTLADRLALRGKLSKLYAAGKKYGESAGINTEADIARVIKEVRQGL